MKKLSEMPKTRLAIFSFVLGIGLSILVLQIITEFIYPHDPDEALATRIIFVLVCSIPTLIAGWATIMSAKEILRKV